VTGPAPADDLWWGATSSSLAAEGVAPTAGWAGWEREGRAPRSGAGGGFATDYADDLAQLTSLGLTRVRITLEWARLEPRMGTVDHQAHEHYRHVLTAARANGLQVWATLAHTTLPGWFEEDERGWRDATSRSRHWLRHVERTAERFEDLVDGWVPIEDPVGWAVRSHLWGTRPPGRRDPEQFRDTCLGSLDANHAAWRILRGGPAPVMCVLGLPTLHATSPAGSLHLRRWERLLWTLPIGALRDGILEMPDGGLVEKLEMAESFDFVGIAHDHPVGIDATGAWVRWPAASRAAADGFVPVVAELREALHHLADRGLRRPLVVASHGVATDDDTWREEIVRDTVATLRAARADGIDVVGYFHDSGVDGYDADLGFAAPRGLIGRDRKVKPSGRALATLLGA
jgi:beta-glucosidase